MVSNCKYIIFTLFFYTNYFKCGELIIKKGKNINVFFFILVFIISLIPGYVSLGF